MKTSTLCVFCSSSDLVPEHFREDAITLANRMVEERIALVYGGGSVGLMGILADRVLGGGGNVIGVIPQFLRTEELAHEGLTEMIVTQTMHERKIEMGRRADAFAVLPGGFGTMDEFFEILTWRQLGLHAKPIIVANTGGWFDPILSYFRHAENMRMVSRENLALVEVVSGGEKVVETLLRRQDPAGSLPRLSRS
jgi:uncharacterized protein (TIGR00730 family)